MYGPAVPGTSCQSTIPLGLFPVGGTGASVRGISIRTFQQIFIRDSGLLHQLLGIRTERDLLAHPKCGASWEGHAIEEIIRLVEPDNAYFWATHTGAELDLLLFKDGRRIGVEVKRQDAPRLTPSMRHALDDLRLDHLAVLYPGSQEFKLAENVQVVPAVALATGDPRVILPARPRAPSRARRAKSDS